MKTFFWQAGAGVLWLAVLQLAELAGTPPQYASLARSAYLALFSIFLLLELRARGPEWISRRSDLLWFLVPLLSVPALALYGEQVRLTYIDSARFAVFYAGALLLLVERHRRGETTRGAWDVVPALLFAALLAGKWAVAAGAAVVVVAAFALSRRPWVAAGDADRGVADVLIIQLPSLCIAPALLIAFRDVFDFSGVVSRGQVEAIGMVVNGLGAAAWTAMVMRRGTDLRRMAGALWVAGAVVSVAPMFTDAPAAVSGLSLLAAELLRGCLWMGITEVARTATRWRGFTIALVATVVPFTALMLLRHSVDASHLMLVYALIHLAVPVFLALEQRRGRRAA